MDKSQKLIIYIAIVIVSIISLTSLIIFLNKDKFTKKVEFVIPSMEEFVSIGKPINIPKEYMYQEVKVNDNYIVYLCAVPEYKDNLLNIYFTSINTNTGLMKIKIYDKSNNLIGESGLIEPNNYIKSVSLTKNLKNKEKITIKVMNYEKDTYYSLGSIKLDVFVKKA